MPFNPNFTATKMITVPNPAVGALPGTWTIFSGCQTPRDVVGGGYVWEPASAIIAPFGYWNSDDIVYNTNTRYIRASASLRISNDPTPGRGTSVLCIVVGTRVNADPTTTPYLYLVGIRGDEFAGYGALSFLRSSVGGWVSFKYQFNADRWYRIGIELLGRTINGYADPVGYNNLSDPPGDHLLQYVATVQADEDTGDDISVGFGLSSSATLPSSPTNFSGIGNMILEKLTPLAGGTGGTGPGTDIPLSFTGSPIDYGGIASPTGISGGIAHEGLSDVTFDPSMPSWDPLKGFTISSRAYAKYKTVRSAAAMLNNVTLQP